MSTETEADEIGSCIIQLAHDGEKKGNFKIRLDGALEAIEKIQKKDVVVEIKSVEEQVKFLRDRCKNGGKDNRHIMGMVE